MGGMKHHMIQIKRMVYLNSRASRIREVLSPNL